jgi:ABC-type phosphate transport system permease subunit
MLKKINLGSTIAALFLFLLPWVDIQCSQKSLFTQSGLQIIYGGASASEEMKSLSNGESTDSKDSLGVSILVALALILVALSVFFSWNNFCNANKQTSNLSLVLPAVALGLLLLQLMIGFPAKNKISESTTAKNFTSQSSEDQFEELGKAMAMTITAKTTWAFYLELLMLGIPTAILINEYLDKIKKNNSQ